MPIPAADIHVAEIVVHGLMAAGGSDAVPTVNIFHYRRTATAIDPSKDALEAIFETDVVTVLLAMLNARWTHTRTAVRWIDDALDAYTEYTYSDVGGVAGDSLQSDQALYLLLRTSLRGREYRGSKHFGPLSESDTTTAGDVLNAGAITRAGNLATAMENPLADADGNNWVPCVLSRKLSQLTVNPTTVTSNDIVQVLVNKRIGNMKRRQVPSVY